MKGGKRPGAGRRLGSQNIVSQELREQILREGPSPLEYLVEVMRDVTQDTSIRMDAAKAVAPFIHPKLQSVEHSTTDEVGYPTKIEIVFVKAEPQPLDLPAPAPPSPALPPGMSVWEEPEAPTFVPDLF